MQKTEHQHRLLRYHRQAGSTYLPFLAFSFYGFWLAYELLDPSWQASCRLVDWLEPVHPWIRSLAFFTVSGMMACGAAILCAMAWRGRRCAAMDASGITQFGLLKERHVPWCAFERVSTRYGSWVLYYPGDRGKREFIHLPHDHLDATHDEIKSLIRHYRPDLVARLQRSEQQSDRPGPEPIQIAVSSQAWTG